MERRLALSLFAVFAATGCGSGTVVPVANNDASMGEAADADRDFGDGSRFSLDGAAGSVPAACDDRLKSIFVVTTKTPQAIFSFDPVKVVFTHVIDVVCPNTGSWVIESMGVDRAYGAWVSWGGKRLDRVDLASGACRTDVAPVLGKMGMAFTSDSPGSSAESLFFMDSSTKLYRLGGSTPLGQYYMFKPLEGTEFSGVELSGSGSGRLFAFIMNWTAAWPPSNVPGPPTVHIGEVDPKNGSAISNEQVGDIPAFGVSPGSFAFAQWGGLLWVFEAPNFGPTKVYAYDPVAKTATLKKTDGPDGVTGAGVSTCAPSEPPK